MAGGAVHLDGLRHRNYIHPLECLEYYQLYGTLLLTRHWLTITENRVPPALKSCRAFRRS